MGLEFALQQEGYTVCTTSGLDEAAHSQKKTRFDLLLLDVALPDGDGMDLCRRIRCGELSGKDGASTLSMVPIVFLTARDDEIDVVRGLELGGDDYVNKPFRLKELLSRIRALFRTADNAEFGFTIKTGDLMIDSRRAEVMKGGQKVNLTAAE